MNNWLNNTLHKLLPSSCLLCDGASHNTHIDLCPECEQELPYLTQGCSRCGQPISGVNATCGQCLTNPPNFDHCFSLLNYAAPVDKLVQKLKFNGKLAIARSLGELFAQTLVQNANAPYTDCIIPVPLHTNRIRQRGFNQALELARPVAKRLNIKIDKTSCSRIINTQPQSNLAADDRITNVRNAFAVVPTIKWKRVVLFDDVFTTGQTVNALAKQLKLQGVEEITVWCIAKVVL